VRPVCQQDFAAHPQVEQQPTLSRLHLNPLAVGSDGEDLGSGQRRLEFSWRQVQAFGLEDQEAADRPSGQLLVHVTGKNGNLG
jgi:hypothetical protein